MKPGPHVGLACGRWLFLSFMALIQPVIAQNQQGGANNPPVPVPSFQPAQPVPALPAIPDLPGMRDSGAAGAGRTPSVDAAVAAAQDRLVDQAIPIEDLVLILLERMADDAEADLEDMLDELAASREERAALRERRQQAREKAQEADRRRQMERQERRKAAREARRDARHAAHDAREERREALREARAAERHKRWVAREKARMERDARRSQRATEREAARETRREAREQRRRKSSLVASLVSAVVDQFNAVEGPLPARVSSILGQIDSQVAQLGSPPSGADEGKKQDEDSATLGQQVKSLRMIWSEFMEATGISSAGGVRCTTCE